MDFTRHFFGFLFFGVSFVVCVSLAITPLHDAQQSLFVALGCTTATVLQKQKLVELRLVRLVRITAGLGTMALRVGSVFCVTGFTNYGGVH